MLYFKGKMHQIRFRLGLRPRPRWGSLQCSADPLAGFYRPTSKRRGKGRGEEGKGKGRGRKTKTRGERGRITMGFSLPKVNFLVSSLLMFSFINNEIEAVGAYIK